MKTNQTDTSMEISVRNASGPSQNPVVQEVNTTSFFSSTLTYKPNSSASCHLCGCFGLKSGHTDCSMHVVRAAQASIHALRTRDLHPQVAVFQAWGKIPLPDCAGFSRACQRMLNQLQHALNGNIEPMSPSTINDMRRVLTTYLGVVMEPMGVTGARLNDFVNLAVTMDEDSFNVHIRQMFDAASFITAGAAGGVDAAKAAMHNKVMHMLNGNIHVPKFLKRKSKNKSLVGRPSGSQSQTDTPSQLSPYVCDHCQCGNGVAKMPPVVISKSSNHTSYDRPSNRFLPECDMDSHIYVGGYCIFCKQYEVNSEECSLGTVNSEYNTPCGSSGKSSKPHSDLSNASGLVASFSSGPDVFELGMCSDLPRGQAVLFEKNKSNALLHSGPPSDRASLAGKANLKSNKSIRAARRLAFVERSACPIELRIATQELFRQNAIKTGAGLRKARSSRGKAAITSKDTSGIIAMFDNGESDYVQDTKERRPSYDFEEKRGWFSNIFEKLGYNYDVHSYGDLPTKLRELKPADDIHSGGIDGAELEHLLNMDLLQFLYAKKLPVSEYKDKKGFFDFDLALLHMHKLTEQFYSKADNRERNRTLECSQRDAYTQSYVAREKSKEFFQGDHATYGNKREGFCNAYFHHKRPMIIGGLIVLSTLACSKSTRSAAVSVSSGVLLAGSLLVLMNQTKYPNASKQKSLGFLNHLCSVARNLTS